MGPPVPHGLLLVLLLSGYCVAGPVREEVIEGANPEEDVCVVKNVTFAKGDVVPDVAPCETCICEPPEVKCSPVKCQTNNGCKIIQQSGKCCPDYKCDCEHEGTTYNNGEKLHNPSSPCQVCYCRGGEIMCNSITCYQRDDCEPHHVEGQCCPKYGHCPPKNSSSFIAVPADPSGLSTKREMQPWLLTKSVNLHTTATPSQYPQTIKIVEILPTQGPVRPGEVSLVPRIITNGGPDRVSSAELSTSSYTESSSTESSNVAEPLKMSSGSFDKEDESVQPDSETYTTLLPQMADVTAAYDEFSALTSEVTEGEGYDLVSGGTFFPNTTNDSDSSEEQDGPGSSSEENDRTTTSIPDKSVSSLSLEVQNPDAEVTEDFEAGNQTISANLEVESVEDANATSISPDSASEEFSKGDGLVTRHGLTIPPILNLNQFHHLTLGGTGEDSEEKSVVRIGVYNPTNPGEVSNLVTVIKNEDTPEASGNSATTQVLLTPQDLKTLAELIIKEKIRSPDEKVERGTTPLPTETDDGTTGASPEFSSENENSTQGEVEDTTPHSDVSSKKSLSKEELKTQVASHKNANSTVEVYPANETETLSNTEAEWVEVSNSTLPDVLSRVDRISLSRNATAEIDSTSTDREEETTTEPQTSTSTTDDEGNTSFSADVSSADMGKSRGSLRQMEDLVSRSPDVTDRRTRITTANDPPKQISMAMFDEKDQMLVENFFKKALHFH